MRLTRAGFIGTICSALGLAKVAEADNPKVIRELRGDAVFPIDAKATVPSDYVRADVIAKAGPGGVPLPENIWHRQQVVHLQDDRIPVPTMPPPTGRNPGYSFGGSPLDEVRLAELLCFMKAVGFIEQSILSVRRRDDYGRYTIEFAQASDPRLPADGAELTKEQIAMWQQAWKDAVT